MIPKTDAIDAITRLNPTARPSFLAEFSAAELADYLDRLRAIMPLEEITAGTDGDLHKQPRTTTTAA